MMNAAQFLISVIFVSDSFLSNAGWIFFAGWSAILTVLCAVAFRHDLLPSRAHIDAEGTSNRPIRPSHSRIG